MVYKLNIALTQDYNVEYEALDGDMDAVKLMDYTPDEGGKPQLYNGGRPIDPTHVPNKVRWKYHKRLPKPDFDSSILTYDVSERAKQLIEQFEPGVHQFLPVEFFDIDGNFMESRWFFICCNRLDTVDRDQTRGLLLKTYPSGKKSWIHVDDLRRRNEIDLIPPGYDSSQPAKLVFNRKQIGGAHLWVDSLLRLPSVYVSDEFIAACVAAGMTGLKAERKRLEEVD